MSAPALHPATVSALTLDPDAHTVYQGLLREGSPSGREVWRCSHQHPKRPGARACAHGELRQRALPDLPEMRGNWGGMTRNTGRRDPADGQPIYAPICPMCAKALLHAQAEHERLEKAALREKTKHA
jgi:hypothetical protein